MLVYIPCGHAQSPAWTAVSQDGVSHLLLISPPLELRALIKRSMPCPLSIPYCRLTQTTYFAFLRNIPAFHIHQVAKK